jgi:hypothetical protein
MKKIYLILSMMCFWAYGNAQLVIFDDDYGTGVSFVPFGGSTNDLTIDGTEARPGSAGTKSLKIGVPGGNYTGGAFVAGSNQNATAFTAISFWVKASKSAALDVTGLGNNSGAPTGFETEYKNIAISTTWTRIIIPVPDASKLTAFNGLFHFAEGSGEGAYTIWVDDIQYENIASVGVPSAAGMASLNLNVPVGGTVNATDVTATIPVDGNGIALAPVGRGFLTYTTDPVGRVTFDGNGNGTAQNAGMATVTATLRGTPVAGTINITVVPDVKPNVPAPTPPVRESANVVSVFSEAYASAATMSVAEWSGNTGAVVQAAGVDVWQVQTSGTPFVGFNLSSGINLTNMTHMHVDFWIAGTTQPGAVFNPGLSQHNGGHLTGQSVQYIATKPVGQGEEGKWISFDIPFTDFNNGLSGGRKDIISQMTFNFDFLSLGAPIFIDNIYFYKEGPPPPPANEPNVPAPTPPARIAEGVISIFSDAYAPAATMSVPEWSGNTASIVQAAGADVWRIQTSGGAPFVGFNVSNALNLTNMAFMHFDIWIGGVTAPGGVFNPKLSQHSAGHLTGETNFFEKTLAIAQGEEGKWLSFDIPFSEFGNNLVGGPKNIISQILFTFPNLSVGAPIFLDNVYFYSENSLPVKLTAFTAAAKANSVVLNWETATEINNRGFAVERSKDGRAWSELTFVNSTAPNGGGSTYTSVDFSPLKGMNFYRLRQMDFDGKFSFSPVKQVNFNGKADAVSVYPNPARGTVNVLVDPTSKNVNYSIINAMGRSLKSGILLSEGNVNKVNLQGLPAGVYMLQVTDEKGTKTTRLVVQ